MHKLFSKYFELTFWVTSLAALALMQPATGSHFSFCMFKIIGISFCPGCGLGHSICYFFHGNWQASFSAHPFGIFAVLIILARTYKLFRLHFTSQKSNNYAVRP